MIPENEVPDETPEIEVPEGEAVDTTIPEETTEDTRANIPVGALQEERKKRQELEQKWSRAEDRLNQLTEHLSKKEQEEQAWLNYEPEPEWDDDDLRSQNAYLKNRIDQLFNGVTGYAQQQEADRASQQFVSSYNNAAGEFAKQNPDFEQAAGHYWQSRRQELEILGLAPNQVNDILQNDFLGIAYQGMQSGQNPAEKIYELAKMRGYTPQEADDKIERLQKGQHAAKSLSSAGGRTEPSLNLEALAEMDDAEFGKLLEEDPDAFRKVMGG